MVARPWAMMVPPNIVAIPQAAYSSNNRARSGFTATDMPHRSVLGTRIHARATLHARHQRLTPGDGLRRQRQSWASVLTKHAGRAARLVDLHIEHARLVKNRLERAKRAEECALGPLLRQQGQHYDQSCEQYHKDSVLDQPHRVTGGDVFRHCLERAEPHAVSRLKQSQ